MNSDSMSRTRDVSILQLLTRLRLETDKIVKLADDISAHATTPQAKSAMNLIGAEMNNILQIIKMSIDPLYNLYDIDPGLKAAKAASARFAADSAADGTESGTGGEKDDDYDENMLWSDIINKEKP